MATDKATAHITTTVQEFPEFMYYLRDPHSYASRVKVRVEKVEVFFPLSIAPQLYIHATGVDETFAVSADSSQFRGL
jgi:hypothetical protein